MNNGKNSCTNANEIQGELSFENSNVFEMSLELNITRPLPYKNTTFLAVIMTLKLKSSEKSHGFKCKVVVDY